ncbi:MAG: type 4a pilus biogenesis protein PilO, partial [Candidatus Eisenbacteria bacterium]|nr:type 4a pilus biogenesis protein PilO [Candidatus Eisenbacteria bacterium]
MAIQLNDPKTQKAALATILGLAVLYVYFLTSLFPFTYKASAAQIGELNGRYTQLSSDLTKARQTVHSMAYLEQEYELLHRKWLSAEALLPDEQEMASLLRAVTLLGDQSGIDFVLFRPLPEQAAQYYTEHPVEVQVEGG